MPSLAEKESLEYFGKYQKSVAIASYSLIYCTMFSVLLHQLYSILSLNYPFVIFYATIILLQTRVKRNQKCIDFFNEVIQIRKAFKLFTVKYEQEIPNSKKSMFGYHPHGATAAGFLPCMNFKNEPLSSMVALVSRFILHIPFIGIIMRLWGVQSVDPSNFKRLLQEGQRIGVIPGGYEDGALADPNQLSLYLKDRKGFIKYALSYNYTIYPVLSLTQHKMFSTLPYLLPFRLWLCKHKIAAWVFWNFKTIPLIRNDIEFQIVVGKGIKGRVYQTGQRPTSEEVDKAHAQYIEELKRIHEKHKEVNDLPLKIY